MRQEDKKDIYKSKGSIADFLSSFAILPLTEQETFIFEAVYIDYNTR